MRRPPPLPPRCIPDIDVEYDILYGNVNAMGMEESLVFDLNNFKATTTRQGLGVDRPRWILLLGATTEDVVQLLKTIHGLWY